MTNARRASTTTAVTVVPSCSARANAARQSSSGTRTARGVVFATSAHHVGGVQVRGRHRAVLGGDECGRVDAGHAPVAAVAAHGDVP